MRTFLVVMLLLCLPATAVAAKPSVQGASTAHRQEGLVKLEQAWAVAAPYYHQSGSTMPRIWFSHIPLIATIYTPRHRQSTQQVLWPDWVNSALLLPAGDKTADGFSASDALAMMIHEWTHYYQRTNLSNSDAEGGAQLFTRLYAPAIIAKLGMVYRNPRFSRDQYPTEMRHARRHGIHWIRTKQLVTIPGYAGTKAQ